MRNLMSTLFLTQGVPMISGGDELQRTQQGNNNAYCQDNEISWTDWTPTEEREAFFEFTCRVNRVMREHAVLRRRKFFQGRRIRGAEVKDIMWLSPTGEEMTEPEWNAGHAQCLGVRLAGDSMDELDADGNPVSGDTLVYLMNAAAVSIEFVLPAFVKRPRWACLLDTFDASREGAVFDGDYRYPLAERSLAVFRMEPRSAAERRARVSV
jgi:glycogen operon protein